MEVRDVLEGRRQELNGELQTLEMEFDDAMVSDVEYNYRKADIKSRIDEVDTITNKMANHRILSSEEDKQGCLIGSNGTTTNFSILIPLHHIAIDVISSCDGAVRQCE